MKDEDPFVRFRGVMRLHLVEADLTPAIPDLTRAVADPSERVREAAIEFLATLSWEAPAIEPAVGGALEDPVPRVRLAASAALLTNNARPEQAAAAVDAGRHVYLAKPIAVDVPGCHTIADSSKRASAKKLCFLVDFQTRANEFYLEALKRVHEGALGRFAFGERRPGQSGESSAGLGFGPYTVGRYHYRAKYSRPGRCQLDYE